MSTAPVPAPSVRFDCSGPAVVIDNLTVADPVVIAEARCWASGQRGPIVDAKELATADLSNYVVQALMVGAHAIGTAGGVQQAYDLKDLVTEVGERTMLSAQQAAAATDAAIAKATTALEAAATQARKDVGEMGELARRGFTAQVDAARRALGSEIQRLVGGDSPELLARLQPLVDRFGRELGERSTRHAEDLVQRVARQFDPADPSSVLAQQNRLLEQQHLALVAALTKEQTELATKVDELATAVKVAHAARTAAAATAQRTPLKGETYADAVHRAMVSIAAGLGDDYTDTSAMTGMVSRCRKGDGVLAVDGGDVRVVVEMSDSPRSSGWGPYLAEAERNRDAYASIGLVRFAEQLRGHTMIALGARRIVLAYDPETDRPDLLRTVVQVVRLAAVAVAQRAGGGELRIAEEKISAALAALSRIDTIETAAGAISKSAAKISGESGALRLEITCLLRQAAAALSGTADGGTPEVAA